MDMRSMVDMYAMPDSGVSEWPLARRYGLPALGSAGASNAKLFDTQAAVEAALTLFANTASSINLSQNIGYLDLALTGSLELVVFCDEVIGWISETQISYRATRFR